MPDAPRPYVSQEERHRLRRQATGLAGTLVDCDTVADGAQVLAEYRERFGQSTDHFLKHGLAALFMSDLMRRCCPHQCRQVAYLLEEHLAECGSQAMEQILRQTELAMFRRFKDAAGEAKCLRILKGLNKKP